MFLRYGFCLTLLLFLPPIAGQEQKHGPSAVNRLQGTTSASGFIEYYTPCGLGPCAAAKSPNYYNFVSSDAIYRTLGQTLQSMGFGINPKGLKPKISEFRSDKPGTFWTDFLPLDEKALHTFGATRSALRLSEDPSVFYEIQVGIICSAKNPLLEMLNESPGKAMTQVESEGSPLQTRTYVDLAFILIVKKRGQKSSFVEDNSNYNGGPILDWIYKAVKEAIEDTKSDERRDAHGMGYTG